MTTLEEVKQAEKRIEKREPWLLAGAFCLLFAFIALLIIYRISTTLPQIDSDYQRYLWDVPENTAFLKLLIYAL